MIRYFTKRIVKLFFPKFTSNYSIKNFAVGTNNAFLRKSGWMRSLEEGKPVDEDGYSIPWLNYSVIELFRDLGKNDFHLFEWGSGHGTLFFARLFKTVTSRDNCLAQACQTLSEAGIILLDDTERDKLSSLDQVATAQGFRQLKLSGLKPLRNVFYTATLLYREKIIFYI